ncbi:MAG: biopolymer transporter ExbD [Myxococcales bacterium]|nr:biopolymer transporter ExbD [Myxococcales bacterium]
MAVDSQRRGAPITAINVTPLVDVVLVLLVIFMATADRMQPPAIDVDLPEASQASEAPSTPVALVLSTDGKLRLNGEVTSADTVEAYCRRRVSEDRDTRALIAADGAVRHREVVALVDLVKRAGIAHFAIQVELPER